jgi:hypothetical protein
MTTQMPAHRAAELRARYAVCTANHPEDDRCEWMRHDAEHLEETMTEPTTSRRHYQEHARELHSMHVGWERQLRHCTEDPTCTKDERTDLENIVHDVRKHLNAYRKALQMAPLLAACALALSLSTAGAQTQCHPAGTTGEGFPVIACVDGRWYQDMDGSGGYNSGLPYVPPGAWVRMSDESPVFE